ncbi:response regulator [Bacillus sp. FJAT-50079]|uniref:response regulator n=1 Tax=Bacillus sp. FJAT-50079 TaxID=2833577 RepID=UPI001BC8DB08|nr:response regulator [Bacillus sp. FJAT-50079]MBS4210480.1 response regulator [Bacillus sp. FJAT-50079]
MNVLIVDDEDMIREGISSSISWKQLEMNVIGKAEDGLEALEIFYKNIPEIVITDIKMPFMNGLELIEKIRNEFPDTYIIIISGYDQFEYAQKAVKMGAFDYILKPIEIDYVESLLLKIKKDYDNKKMHKKSEKLLKEQADNSLELLQTQFLKDIMVGKITDEKIIEEKSKKLGFDRAMNNYNKVIILDMDDSAHIYNNTLDKEFSEIIKGIIQTEHNVYSIEIEKKRMVICCLGEGERFISKRISEISKKIRNELLDQLQKTITIGFGENYNSLCLLQKSYEEALRCLEYKFFMGYNQNIYYEDIKDRVNHYSNVINNNDNEIIYSLDFSNKALLSQSVTQIFSKMKDAGGDSYLYTKMIVSSIYMYGIRALNEVEGTIDEVFDNPIVEIENNTKYQTIDAVIENLISNLHKISDYISSRKYGEFKYIVEKAKGYINQKYCLSTFSINDVAKYSNMSVSYFSMIFKRETGFTFIDYLTMLRVDKAKYLLKVSNYKTYEISEIVGYNNSTYFSTTFKKYTGYSPSSYRKIHINKEILGEDIYEKR